ncbi:MAG TPA: hypothetical protein VG369_01180 [Humibacter sp.]|nr:hypothetical protein [Humibacter sp.]
MGKRNVGGPRAVTRRTIILAGSPQYAGVAMAGTIVPAVAQASEPLRDDYADAVGAHFDAASEYGHFALTLASVESLGNDRADADTRFGLMFTVCSARPPAGVYRLCATEKPDLPDAQLFIAASAHSRRSSSRRLAGRRS